jgi:Protein of unknown function (DUF1064)
MPKTASSAKCKHPKLDVQRRCKSCGLLVDIREKRSKYGNRRVDCFDSAKEAERYQVLRLEKEAGLIADLEIHPEFDLIVNGEYICKYIADFHYLRLIPGSCAGKRTVEDVKPAGKSFRKTAAYRVFIIKKNLMKACHRLDVVEV